MILTVGRIFGVGPRADAEIWRTPPEDTGQDLPISATELQALPDLNLVRTEEGDNQVTKFEAFDAEAPRELKPGDDGTGRRLHDGTSESAKPSQRMTTP